MGRNGCEAKESCSRYELIAMAIHSGRLLEVVGPAAYALPPHCLFSRRIVNETRINCENFNPEKKSTTVSPIHRNLFRRADKNPGIIYILLTLLLLYTQNNFPSLDNFIKLLFKPFRGVVLVRITVGFNVFVAHN